MLCPNLFLMLRDLYKNIIYHLLQNIFWEGDEKRRKCLTDKLGCGHRENGHLTWWKISKHHFLKDIENSFHEVTHIGLEPHQFFSFKNISTNTVARDIQSFGWNGPWLAGWLSYSQITKNGVHLLRQIFGGFSYNSNKNQDIFLKFSAFVHHKSLQIWRKNFGQNSNSLPATAHFGQNFKRL